MLSFAEKQKEVKEQVAKDAIFDATVAVLLEKGIEGLKMQAIAEQAGIAIGTLYNYFDNKAKLLYYADRKLRDAIIERLERITAQPEPADQKLDLFVSDFLTSAARYHVVFDLAEKAGIFDQIPLAEKKQDLRRVVGCLETIFAQGVEQKLFRSVPAGESAEIFFLTMIGILEAIRFFNEKEVGPRCLDFLKVLHHYLHVDS
jgi:TetR/AcrR family fatty acid metabolism transcriptional regulator